MYGREAVPAFKVPLGMIHVRKLIVIFGWCKGKRRAEEKILE